MGFTLPMLTDEQRLRLEQQRAEPARVGPVPTRVDAWRRQNPDAFHTWKTKTGCVVQFWGMRVFYGRCRDCAGLVTKRRNIQGHRFRRGQTNIGRWPERCPECTARVTAKHDAGATERMRRLRAERKAFRDAAYEAAGLPPVRQGVKAGKP